VGEVIGTHRPGEIRFASAGIGTGTHLAVAKLNRDLGIAAVHTPPAATDAITDVIAGTAAGLTTYAMLPIPPAAPYLHDGGLAALGVSTARRSRLLPDVPPLTEAGVAGFDFPIWYGIWAPAQTPAGIHFRWACSTRFRVAVTTFADNSRHASPWAAAVYAGATARGHEHQHAIRILARAWTRVIYRCWLDATPYDPERHGNATKLSRAIAA